MSSECLRAALLGRVLACLQCLPIASNEAMNLSQMLDQKQDTNDGAANVFPRLEPL